MPLINLSRGFAMDLGTANTLIYEQGRGIVLNEPSMICRDKRSGRILTVGHEAKTYFGRTPANMEVVRPLRDGVIDDFNLTQQMIRHFLSMAGISRGLFGSKILIGVPIGITQVEKRSIIEAAEKAGAKSVNLIDEPVAAAVGLKLPIEEPTGHLILDVGGGTTEGVVLSLGAIAASESRRLAGDAATEAIGRYIQNKFKIAVGELMAEHIKMTIGSAMPLEETSTMTCRGKDLCSGIPKEFELTDEDIREALSENVAEFIRLIKILLENMPPEMSGDLMRDGIYLTGGGALLKNLDQLISSETGLKVNRAENALTSVVLGLGHILENYKKFKKIFTG